jgi:hypothetical protein
VLQALNFFSFDMYSKAFANMFGAECQSAKFAAGACAGEGRATGEVWLHTQLLPALEQLQFA